MLPATLWLCLVCAGLDFAAAVAPSLRVSWCMLP